MLMIAHMGGWLRESLLKKGVLIGNYPVRDLTTKLYPDCVCAGVRACFASQTGPSVSGFSSIQILCLKISSIWQQGPYVSRAAHRCLAPSEHCGRL